MKQVKNNKNTMKTYETVDEYLQHHKIGDRIAFAGYGIVDGLKHLRKHGTYKVVKGTTDTRISLKAYGGRTPLTLGANRYDQKVVVLNKKEFEQLPKY